MNNFRKIYFISMQIMALIIAITSFILPIVLSVLYVLPYLPIIRESQYGPGIIFAWIFSICLFIMLIYLLIKAFIEFKKVRNLKEQELLEHRPYLFGYGIFVGILCLPALLGLAMLVCAIFINDNLKENQSLNDNKEKKLAELEQLKTWKEQGYLTESEYEILRKKLLGL